MDDLLSAFDRAARWIDDYYRHPERYPVLSRARPGDLHRALPAEAPEDGEAFETIFADFESLVLPGITHWNHPRFFAYFSISATPAAVVAEALAAALDVNAMLWRTSPAATELEEVVLVWLRTLLGLDDGLHGIVYDTASIAGFTALAAAREALGLGIRDRGMGGRSDLPPLRVYVTEHTHSHVEKAAIALGIGRANVVKIACDDAFAMRPDALEAALAADVARGMRPMCVAATVGTTSTTSSDPVPAIAEIARRYAAWLHVDASYAGPAAIVPEFRTLLAGCEFADSLVVNPHKWLFVPIDLSVLYVRDMENLRRTFSLVADYLVTSDGDVRNYMDYGLQLGRRFRALKLWFAIRHLGVNRMRDLLRGHVALAQTFATWVEAEPAWIVVAPHPLSVVCFRHEPAGVDGGDALDAHNLAIVDRVNASGEAYFSTTKLNGRVAIRIAIGNERTTLGDVAAGWRLLREAATTANMANANV
ncbi:MAG: amino acid decarboxylase [Candidatus Eremiobacteraeota bacterium]|nr:amino acid decarboxylase [Candidatus Eremiobacteraeota bacterium]